MKTRTKIQAKPAAIASSPAAPTNAMQRSPDTEANEFSDQRESAPPAATTTPNLQAQVDTAARLGHNFGDVGVHANTAPARIIQRQLVVGAPGDKYEQEADQMAERATSLPSSSAPAAVQRKDGGEEEVSLKPVTPVQRVEQTEDDLSLKPVTPVQRVEQTEDDLALQPTTTVQREFDITDQLPSGMQDQVGKLGLDNLAQGELPSSTPAGVQKPADAQQQVEQLDNALVEGQAPAMTAGAGKVPDAAKDQMGKGKPGTTPTPTPAPQATAQASLPNSTEGEIQRQTAQGGEPLPVEVQDKLRQLTGMADPELIVIHRGSDADALCKSLRARAFTTRNHIFFADGEYDPGSEAGLKLIIHEATHTMQQGATHQANQAGTPVAPAEPAGNETAGLPAAPMGGDTTAAVPDAVDSVTQTPDVQQEDDKDKKEEEEKQKKEAEEKSGKAEQEEGQKGEGDKQKAQQQAQGGDQGAKQGGGKGEKAKPEQIPPMGDTASINVGDTKAAEYDPEITQEPETQGPATLPTWDELASGTVQLSPQETQANLDHYNTSQTQGTQAADSGAAPSSEPQTLDRDQMIADALKDGAWAGFKDGAKSAAISTGISLLTGTIQKRFSSLPVGGFVAIAQIAMNPKEWWENNVVAIGKNFTDIGSKFSAIGDEDTPYGMIAAVLEFLNSILTFANSILGLISTVLSIVAAVCWLLGVILTAFVFTAPAGAVFAGIASAISPWLPPLGTITTIIGLVQLGLTGLIIPLRSLDLKYSAANPETLLKKQEKLKGSMQGFTSQVTQNVGTKLGEKAVQKAHKWKAKRDVRSAEKNLKDAKSLGQAPDDSPRKARLENELKEAKENYKAKTGKDYDEREQIKAAGKAADKANADKGYFEKRSARNEAKKLEEQKIINDKQTAIDDLKTQNSRSVNQKEIDINDKKIKAAEADLAQRQQRFKDKHESSTLSKIGSTAFEFGAGKSINDLKSDMKGLNFKENWEESKNAYKQVKEDQKNYRNYRADKDREGVEKGLEENVKLEKNKLDETVKAKKAEVEQAEKEYKAAKDAGDDKWAMDTKKRAYENKKKALTAAEQDAAGTSWFGNKARKVAELLPGAGKYGRSETVKDLEFAQQQRYKEITSETKQKYYGQDVHGRYRTDDEMKQAGGSMTGLLKENIRSGHQSTYKAVKPENLSGADISTIDDPAKLRWMADQLDKQADRGNGVDILVVKMGFQDSPDQLREKAKKMRERAAELEKKYGLKSPVTVQKSPDDNFVQRAPLDEELPESPAPSAPTVEAVSPSSPAPEPTPEPAPSPVADTTVDVDPMATPTETAAEEEVSPVVEMEAEAEYQQAAAAAAAPDMLPAPPYEAFDRMSAISAAYNVIDDQQYEVKGQQSLNQEVQKEMDASRQEAKGGRTVVNTNQKAVDAQQKDIEQKQQSQSEVQKEGAETIAKSDENKGKAAEGSSFMEGIMSGLMAIMGVAKSSGKQSGDSGDPKQVKEGVGDSSKTTAEANTGLKAAQQENQQRMGQTNQASAENQAVANQLEQADADFANKEASATEGIAELQDAQGVNVEEDQSLQSEKDRLYGEYMMLYQVTEDWSATYSTAKDQVPAGTEQ